MDNEKLKDEELKDEDLKYIDDAISEEQLIIEKQGFLVRPEKT